MDAGEAALILENIDTRALIHETPPVVDLSAASKDNAILAAAIASTATRMGISIGFAARAVYAGGGLGAHLQHACARLDCAGRERL